MWKKCAKMCSHVNKCRAILLRKRRRMMFSPLHCPWAFVLWGTGGSIELRCSPEWQGVCKPSVARNLKWTIARNFRSACGMDDVVDPSLRAAVHMRDREENEEQTAHTRGETAAARHMLEVQTMGMQTRSRFHAPLVWPPREGR